MKTMTTLKEALEKKKHLKTISYFRHQSEHIPLYDSFGIVNKTPLFALPGKPTGAFTALEMVLRSYFTETPRAMGMNKKEEAGHEHC